jgi:hypothetical protein
VLVAEGEAVSFILNGDLLPVHKALYFARVRVTVELDPAAVGQIKVCRAVVENGLAPRGVIYGSRIGTGKSTAPETARATIASCINVDVHGRFVRRSEASMTSPGMPSCRGAPAMYQHSHCSRGPWVDRTVPQDHPLGFIRSSLGVLWPVLGAIQPQERQWS